MLESSGFSALQREAADSFKIASKYPPKYMVQ